MFASFKVGLICDSDGKTSNLAKRVAAPPCGEIGNNWDLAILGIKFKLSNGMVYMAIDDSALY